MILNTHGSMSSYSPKRLRGPKEVRLIQLYTRCLDFGASPSASQVRYRKSKEYCVSVSAYSQLLNPGRDCSEDYQCIS
jgi:hypothetical protein